MFLFCFALILISYRIGTHQSNANIDRVCRGPSEQARPPGRAPQAFCREQIGKLPRRACALPVPLFPAAARAPGVGGTAFQPTACLPQLTSPRSGGSEGSGVRFRCPLRSSQAPGNRQQPLSACSQPHRVTVMGRAPCFCNLWLPIGARPEGPQPLPVKTASGKADSTTRESA